MKQLKKKNDVKQNDRVGDPLSGDLSEWTAGSLWQMARFEITKPKKKVITLRLSEELLTAVKRRAKVLGLDYQRLIRLTLENSLK